MGRSARLCAGVPRLAPDEPVVGRTAEFIDENLKTAAGSNPLRRGPRGCPSLVDDTSGSARFGARFRGPWCLDPLSKAPVSSRRSLPLIATLVLCAAAVLPSAAL